MKTSAVPTLAQCGDVASAFAFMRESNGVALSPKSIVELIVGGKNGSPHNKILSAYVFALLTDPSLAARRSASGVGPPRAGAGRAEVKEGEASEESPPRNPNQNPKMNTPEGTEQLLSDVSSTAHALGFLLSLIHI